MTNTIWKYFKLGIYFELVLLVVTLVLGFLGITAAMSLGVDLMENISLTAIIVVLIRFVLKGFIMTYLVEKVN